MRQTEKRAVKRNALGNFKTFLLRQAWVWLAIGLGISWFWGKF